MVNQEQRAFRLWKVLVEVSTKNELISYGQAAKRIGIHHRALRFVLSLIQEHCLANNYPPLTILVVNKSGMPGNGFIAYDLNNFQEGKRKVHRYPWSEIRNPFLFAQDGAQLKPVITNLLKGKKLSSDQKAMITVRGVEQLVFRTVVMKAYNNKCAVCQLGNKHLLEAAHIQPWSESSDEDRISVNNGILLCRNHHALFDNGILEIREDFIIKVKYEKTYSDVDKEYLSSIDGARITLPRQALHYPNLMRRF